MTMKNQQKQKSIAALVTGIILLIAFLAMNIAAIPHRDLISEHYDQINWTRFIPRPSPPAPSEQPEARKREEAPRRATEPVIKRIDLKQLEDQLKLADLSLPSRNIEAPGRSQPKPQTSRVDLQSLDTQSFSDFNLSLDKNSPLISAPRTGRKGGSRSGLAVQSSDTEEAGLGDASFGDDVGADLKGAQAIGGGDQGEIDLKALAEFDAGAENFSPIYQPLIEWMKRHPAVLPPVARRFMNHRPGHLTSRVQFQMDGRRFDMLLLCVEASYEVRIVLIENREVTYLIDEGFRKKSNFLRAGELDRLPDGSILKFSTNLRPAGSQRTRQFYRIFLSWWDSVKHEVE